MNIGILNYNACNLASIYNSIYRLGYDPIVINKVNEFKNIDKLIVPGVGAAKSCLEYMKNNNFVDEIQNFLVKGKPILGICLGLQIFSKNLFEHGKTNGLDFLNAEVIPFKNLKTNMGWFNLVLKDNEILNDFNNKSFYFCHTYYLNFLNLNEKKYCFGLTDNENNIPSIIIKKNFMGVQFHPEKSQGNGNKFLDKFLSWEPK
ncbi:imidazole glycerol phosphate synthase subunit HisH [Candidatus Pelagibacter sp.]|nr:imidazole glycerol phosphate synthase subunit HisH [Candidatus Pelagibacter sp.]